MLGGRAFTDLLEQNVCEQNRFWNDTMRRSAWKFPVREDHFAVTLKNMRSCRRAASEIFIGHRGIIGAFKDVEVSFL